ncbi:MAG: SBBP repeat-containing protein [Phycisphaerales bacterium]|nr:SBBP repeat-containing protein [Phycisphaerales bacterium]
MRRFTTSSAMGVVLLCCALFVPLATAGPVESDPAATEMLNLGLRGVYFVPNQGQWSDADVYYGLRSRGLDVAFRESMLTMHMTRETAEPSPDREGVVLDARRETPLADTRGSSGESADLEHLTLTVAFPGSNAVLPIGAQPQTAKFNYFVGGEGRETASNVPSFGAVIYEDLYDGIDLLVCGNDDGVLKYEFHVAPGADYAQIRIAYDGIESLCIDDAGNLQINTSFGTLADGAPVVWQEDSTSRAHASMNRAREEAVFAVERDAPLAHTRGSSDQTIPARFELCGAHTYRIALDGPVDPTRELIIDPDVEWMYYLGGSGDDFGTGVAIDASGDVLISGATTSTDFSGRNNSNHGGGGFGDAFLARLSPAGALRWMTYLGGSDEDLAFDVAVDGAGNLLVAGATASSNFEGRNNAYHGGGPGGLEGDGFVLKVSATGLLQWMTYFGGTQGDMGQSIAVDGAGHAFVTGETNSTDVEGRNNANHGESEEALVVRVGDSGALVWATYLGGDMKEYGAGIAVDTAGNAFVSGATDSTNFEGRNNSTNGPQDAFAAKVSSSGIVQWMTYIGGTGIDYSQGIAIDRAGNVLVVGSTSSTDFARRTNESHGWLDCFVASVNPAGSVAWATFLGGARDDEGLGIAVDATGDCLVTGLTDSTDFEGRRNWNHGGNDAFVGKMSPSGSLQSMSYLGGIAEDIGFGVAAAEGNRAYISGYSASPDFEGRGNAHHGGIDAFAVKLRLADGPQLVVNATCPSGGPIQVSWSGATRGGTIVLLYARNTGSFRIPSGNPCAGTQTGLGSNQIQIAYQGSAGPSGSRTVNSTTGPGACGGYLQLLDVPTCSTSNVALVE